MMGDQIKLGHCYRLRAGRRIIIARVLQISDAPIRLTETPGKQSESFTISNKMVRFQWRAAPKAAWLRRAQMLSLAIFALAAEMEVPCD
jgi:hypothetical protein